MADKREVAITLKLLDETKAALSQANENFSRIKRSISDVGDEGERAGKGLTQAAGGAGVFTRALSGVGDVAKTVLSNSGLGKFGALLGIGGPIAALGAATAIIAQGTRMALEMERSATRVASQLTIGAGSISGATAGLIAAARFNAPGTGFTQTELIRAAGVYGGASGAGVGASIAAMPVLARYSKAYGVDINELGSQLGTLSQYAGSNSEENASLLFGGAESAGSAGKRASYRQLIIDTISTMQASGGGAMFDLGATQRLVNGVARGGGFFASDVGLGMGVRGLEAVGGRITNPFQGAIAMSSGSSLWEALTGDTRNGKVIQERLGYIQHTYGNATADKNGEGNNIRLLLALAGETGDIGTAATLYKLAQSKYGGNLGKITMGDVTHATDAEQRRRENLGTVGGDVDKDIKDLTNALTNVGDRVLIGTVKPALDGIDRALTSNSDALGVLQNALGTNSNWLEYLAVAMAAKTGVDIFGAGRGIIGGVAGLAGRAVGGAAIGASGIGAGALAIGAGLSVALFGLMAKAAGGEKISMVNDLNRLVVQNGMSEDEARARVAAAYAVHQEGLWHHARSDLEDPTKSSLALVYGLNFEGARGYRFGSSVVNTEHHDDGPRGHSGGRAIDLTSVNGINVDPNSVNPTVKGFILDAIHNDPYLRQLGLGGGYLNDPDISSAARSRLGGNFFPDAPGHIHYGVVLDGNTHVLKTPGGEVHVKTTAKFVGKTQRTLPNRGLRKPVAKPGMPAAK